MLYPYRSFYRTMWAFIGLIMFLKDQSTLTVIRGCLQRNVGSPELKWELKAKPGLKTSGDIISRSANIFTTGTERNNCGVRRENKLGNTIS